LSVDGVLAAALALADEAAAKLNAVVAI